MLGFSPLSSTPLAATPQSGSTTNVFNIASKITYFGSNAYASQESNIPGNYYYNLGGGTVITPTGARHVSWFGAEILHSGHGNLHVSSITVEVLHDGFGYLHISSTEVEVLHNAHADLHISQICVEILRSVRAQDDAEVTHVY